MRKIRVIGYQVFTNGSSFQVEIDKVVNQSELKSLRQQLSEKHENKTVYLTYKEIPEPE